MSNIVRSLKISVSGVRGVVGESLTPALVMRFSAAFGEYIGGGTILVGRDARTSGPMFESAVIAGLLSVGCRPLLLGIVATPTVQIAVRNLEANGAVMITASHNPGEWNALKLIGSSGIFLDHNEAANLLNVYHQPDRGYAAEQDYLKIKNYNDAFSAHLNKIIDNIDVNAIRSAKLKVAVDCCNGVGAFFSRKFLETLGCEVVSIFDEQDGLFRRTPEPSAENLKELGKTVRENNCCIGFAQDPDGDRIAFIDETGTPAGEQNSIVLAAEHILSRTPGPVVVNIDTTSAVDEIAKKYGCKTWRTPVGEINVTTRMIELNAVIGGEGGSGGIIWPAVHPCRDSFAGMALMLEMIALKRMPLSEIIATLPTRHMCKAKTPCSAVNAQRIIRKLVTMHPDATPNTMDGLRLDWNDGWILIRASNTEPILRLTAEFNEQKKSEECISTFTEEIKSIEI